MSRFNFGWFMFGAGLFWAGALILAGLIPLIRQGKLLLAAAILGPALGAAVLWVGWPRLSGGDTE